MMKDIQQLVEKYQLWLKDKTSLRQLSTDYIEITTPYLDRHNDYIQIYARKSTNGYILTDDSYTISDLAMSGCTLDSNKRQALLQATLAGFGVTNTNGELHVQTSEEQFPIRKHNLIQAMLAVNDLFYLAQPTVNSLFLEDLAAWLDSLNIRFLERSQFKGRSGYDHYFDFAIPKSRQAPERLIKAINNPTKNTAEALAFAWLDTRETRPADAKAYAIMNDREKSIPSGVEFALNSYSVSSVIWSQRTQIAEELAA